MQKFVIETKTGKNIELDMSIFEVDKEKGMVNLTKIAKACDVRLDVWLKANKTQDFISAMDEAFTPNGVNGKCITVIQGGESSEQGTWGSRELALDFAMWISPRFKVWCIKVLNQILKTGYSWNDIKRITEARDRVANFKAMQMEERYILNISKKLDLPKSETIEKLNNLYLMYGYNNLAIGQK